MCAAFSMPYLLSLWALRALFFIGGCMTDLQGQGPDITYIHVMSMHDTWAIGKVGELTCDEYAMQGTWDRSFRLELGAAKEKQGK